MIGVTGLSEFSLRDRRAVVGTWHGREWWGTGANRQSKTLVLALAFRGPGAGARDGLVRRRQRPLAEGARAPRVRARGRAAPLARAPRRAEGRDQLLDAARRVGGRRAGEASRSRSSARCRCSSCRSSALPRRPCCSSSRRDSRRRCRRGPRRRRSGPRPRAATSSTSRPISCSSSQPLRAAAGRRPRSSRAGRRASSPAGSPASRSASSSARSTWRPGGTTSFTSPIRSASSASHGPAGEGQLQRAAHPDDPRQALRAAVDQRHSPAPLEQAERRVLGRDPQVAPQRDLEPAGQAPAADRGDRGLGRRHAREPHRPLWVLDLEVHRLQVGARAERDAAGARQHHHPRAVVGLEALQGLAQQLGGRRVDGVAALWAVDRDQRRGAGALVPDGGVGHRNGNLTQSLQNTHGNRGFSL